MPSGISYWFKSVSVGVGDWLLNICTRSKGVFDAVVLYALIESSQLYLLSGSGPRTQWKEINHTYLRLNFPLDNVSSNIALPNHVSEREIDELSHTLPQAEYVTGTWLPVDALKAIEGIACPYRRTDSLWSMPCGLASSKSLLCPVILWGQALLSDLATLNIILVCI